MKLNDLQRVRTIIDALGIAAFDCSLEAKGYELPLFVDADVVVSGILGDFEDEDGSSDDVFLSNHAARLVLLLGRAGRFRMTVPHLEELGHAIDKYSNTTDEVRRREKLLRPWQEAARSELVAALAKTAALSKTTDNSAQLLNEFLLSLSIQQLCILETLLLADGLAHPGTLQDLIDTEADCGMSGEDASKTPQYESLWLAISSARDQPERTKSNQTDAQAFAAIAEYWRECQARKEKVAPRFYTQSRSLLRAFRHPAAVGAKYLRDPRRWNDPHVHTNHLLALQDSFVRGSVYVLIRVCVPNLLFPGATTRQSADGWPTPSEWIDTAAYLNALSDAELERLIFRGQRDDRVGAVSLGRVIEACQLDALLSAIWEARRHQLVLDGDSAQGSRGTVASLREVVRQASKSGEVVIPLGTKVGGAVLAGSVRGLVRVASIVRRIVHAPLPTKGDAAMIERRLQCLAMSIERMGETARFPVRPSESSVSEHLSRCSKWLSDVYEVAQPSDADYWAARWALLTLEFDPVKQEFAGAFDEPKVWTFDECKRLAATLWAHSLVESAQFAAALHTWEVIPHAVKWLLSQSSSTRPSSLPDIAASASAILWSAAYFANVLRQSSLRDAQHLGATRLRLAKLLVDVNALAGTSDGLSHSMFADAALLSLTSEAQLVLPQDRAREDTARAQLQRVSQKLSSSRNNVYVVECCRWASRVFQVSVSVSPDDLAHVNGSMDRLHVFHQRELATLALSESHS